ncbi:carboxypeptidase-like regulatory domain-containing protein [Thalassolituus marinus]|uniref:Carboxypeptidase regulatory-like domain-containing protein n=1 Tax=Thalassolituus marinus TaxID=671053 RepID=A0ABS7ZSZ5_9GAMM|nr:carboxypeptidase-like regulatory domain-containing protein [Thalassolituus marinus]MCA6063660.1 carboxypeptidase regulatory-like domain-containing protein [Thalassolituus marinus]
MHTLRRPLLSVGLATLLSAALSGCSDSSSSSSTGSDGEQPSPQAPVTVSGLVTDPAISGAAVRLDDADGNALAQITLTNSLGEFSFADVDSASLDGALISASGGSDSSTGQSFRGLTLQARYQQDSDSVVSPLTTLVVATQQRAGVDYSAARELVAAALGLNAADVDADPASSASVQKANLQLSRLAYALRAANGFSRVDELISTYGNDWQAIADAVAALDIGDSIKTRVAELAPELNDIAALDSSLSAADVVLQANRLSFTYGVQRFLANSLSYTAADASAQANVVALADALWTANGQLGIPSDGAQFANIIRFAFNQYAIDSSNLDDSSWTVPAELSSDSNIASLSTLTVIDHTIPLTDDDLLLTEADKRAYFYASDLAPAYKAERLFDGILDDTIVDPVFTKIAADYALRGQAEKADSILNSQIFTPFNKAYGDLRVGNAYEKRGERETAVIYWARAAEKASTYLQDKGAENMDADDASLFQVIAKAYTDAGMVDEANAVLEPVLTFINANAGSYSTAYGRIIVAIGKTVKAKVELAEENNLRSDLLTDALTSTQLLDSMIDGIGLQTSSTKCGDHYMLRTMYLTTLADYYRRLEQASSVEATINKFVELRATHACTATRTVTYVKGLVEEFAYLDDIAGYMTLVNTTMTDATATQVSQATAAAEIYEAVALAKSGDVTAALAKISTTDVVERVEYLTGSGISLQGDNPKLGVRLLLDGYIDEAAEVLDAAWTLAISDDYLTALTNDGSTYVRYGCGKIAQLTYDYIDQTQGSARLSTCTTLVSDYTANSSVTTEAKAIANAYLASIAMHMGDNSLAQNAYTDVLAQGAVLLDSGSEDAFNTVARSVYEVASAGGIAAGIPFTAFLAPMNDLQALRDTTAADAADEDGYNTALDMTSSLIAYYGYIMQALREDSVQNGIDPALPSYVSLLKERSLALALAGETIANKTATQDTRDGYYSGLFGTTTPNAALTLSEIQDSASQLLPLLSDTESASDINDYRLSIATDILNSDVFLNDAFASQDLDNDGRVDFFSEEASADDIAASALTLDSDSDGDGINDDMDNTPFYCESCAL